MRSPNQPIYAYLAAALLTSLVIGGVLTVLHIPVPDFIPYAATTSLGALVMAARPGETSLLASGLAGLTGLAVSPKEPPCETVPVTAPSATQ